MEFNEIHADVLLGVSRHVASLLTHNEESTAKSARLQSSNELISALQDVALCADTQRLFSLIRERFPPLANCQVNEMDQIRSDSIRLDWTILYYSDSRRSTTAR